MSHYNKTTCHDMSGNTHTLEREQKRDEAGVVGPHHPMLRRFFALAPIYARPEGGKVGRKGTLATQAIALLEMYIASRETRNFQSSLGKK